MCNFNILNTRLISAIFTILFLAIGSVLYLVNKSSPLETENDPNMHVVNQTDDGKNQLELVKETEHVNTSKLPLEINNVIEVEAVTEIIDQGSREKDNPSAQARIAKFDTGGNDADEDTDKDWYIDN